MELLNYFLKWSKRQNIDYDLLRCPFCNPDSINSKMPTLLYKEKENYFMCLKCGASGGTGKIRTQLRVNSMGTLEDLSLRA